MIWASARASLRSVLFGIVFMAAFAWRVSMHTAGRPAARITSGLTLGLKSGLSLSLFGGLDRLALLASGRFDPVLRFALKTGDPFRFFGPHASRLALGGTVFAGRLDRGPLRLTLQHGRVVRRRFCAEPLESSGLGACGGGQAIAKARVLEAHLTPSRSECCRCREPPSRSSRE